ncbi:MAG: hypothetical protein AAB438_00730 [Patescibacteria group bacterium]
MKKIKKRVAIPLAALILLSGGVIGGYASLAGAEGNTSNTSFTAKDTEGGRFNMGRGFGKHRRENGVMGKVTGVINGVITVTDRNGATFTVNAGNAKVEKMVAGTLGDVVVGDSIGVHGAVSGNTVTAVRIMDDLPFNPPNP